MLKAICLVDSSFHLNPAALTLIRSLSGPFHVVGIFGPKCTGKSFLLDQLAGQEEGFGPMPGMWVQCWPHPTKPEENFILLDTEGFPEQMDRDEDVLFSKFFCLNALLSSILIYNTNSDEEPQKELEKLSYVSQLPKMVLVSEDYALENSFLLSSVLPEFVWCVRDVASDSVWEEMLHITDHSMDTLLNFPAASEVDSPVDVIKRLFPSQKVFCFRNPHVDEQDWEAFSADSLHPVFQKQLQAFQNYLLSRKPKRDVSGEVLSKRLELFVEALSRDEPIFLSKVAEALQEAYLWEEGESFIEPMRGPQKTPEEKEAARNAKLVKGESESRQASPLLRPPSHAASLKSLMDGPVCLIENNPKEKLQFNLEALQLLQSIQQPVVVVAIVGLYRTGKSYLMNRLAGKVKGGFSLGATIQANTKGIWMWCVPHPLKPDHTLVLLDTEGLGDVEKSNTENDAWIFALSILLSSTFIFNSMGTINHCDLEQLHYVAELTNHIKVKTSVQQSSEEKGYQVPDEFAFFFPAFVWVVRDFSLQLRLADGRTISEDEYLERALQRKNDIPENQDKVQKYLRQYFLRRKCFVFDRPASRNDLPDLEMLDESQLNPEFLEQAHRFCHYIYKEAQPKTIQGSRVVTGAALGSLAMTYVETIRSGAVPCIENAVLALAQIENSAALQDALRRYKDMVELLANLPTEDISELLTVHYRCEEEAIKVFLARSFHDEDQVCQKQLQNQLQGQLEELIHRNEQESLSRCMATLMELSQELEEKICNGTYLKPGGYQQFLNDQQELVNRYHEVPEKGVKALSTLQDFLKAKETEHQFILKADQTLKDKEKEIAAHKAQAEASWREARRQREIQEDLEEMFRQKERSFQEHERQLMDKMEEDRRRIVSEQEWVLKQKLQEQRRVQEEGFHREVSRLQNEIQSLLSQINRGGGGSQCVIS